MKSLSTDSKVNTKVNRSWPRITGAVLGVLFVAVLGVTSGIPPIWTITMLEAVCKDSLDPLSECVHKKLPVFCSMPLSSGFKALYTQPLIPMCVLMDNLEWYEMLSNAEQSYLLERILV